jgi:hypothetical protein
MGWAIAWCAVLFLLLVIPAGFSDDDFGGGLGFVFQADINRDGADEIIIGIQAKGSDKIAESTEPGDVYVCAPEEGTTSLGSFKEVFSARSVVPEEFLPWFFNPSVLAVKDVDADGFLEVVLVWLEQFWWPSATRPLAILQCDPSQGSYGMMFDTRLSVCEIGDYITEDVDGDGCIEIIQINPVYGSEVNPVTGEEEGECHYCPHCYQIEVFEFDGVSFLIDQRFNGGQPFVTPEKFDPGFGESAVSSFLPQLMDYVHSLTI